MAMKKYVHLFFFVTLIAFKVSAIHVYFHDCADDGKVDDCEICEHAINNQTLAFSFSEIFHSFEVDPTPTFCTKESHYKSVKIKTLVTKVYFGRPPPSKA